MKLLYFYYILYEILYLLNYIKIVCRFEFYIEYKASYSEQIQVYHYK